MFWKTAPVLEHSLDRIKPRREDRFSRVIKAIRAHAPCVTIGLECDHTVVFDKLPVSVPVSQPSLRRVQWSGGSV